MPGVRHEFGDTKHRNVDYRIVGTTRFGDFFPPAMVSTAEDITQTSEVTTLDILSSALPAVPNVQYVVPAFAWTRTPPPIEPRYESKRSGGGLRVYLDPPWFSSGEGELLAVVLSRGISPATAPFVTHWGRDPLWHSPLMLTRPNQQDFHGARMVKEVPLHPEDSEERTRVDVVGYEVKVEDGRCYCDIELDPGLAYYPFVRLALARFQPDSVPDLELSRVVIADFIQLAPERVVSVVKLDANLFEVTVSGTTHGSPTDPVAGGTPTGTRIRIGAQQRIQGTSDDAGWVAADDRLTLSPNVEAATGEVLWQGTVSLSAERNPGQLRLLIEELELYRSVDPAPPVVTRVVFAETVELP